jgi:hypothetical protein
MSVTYAQAIDGNMHITARLARVLVWSLVVVAHLSLFVGLLALFWWQQISPASIKSWAEGVSPSIFGQSVGFAVWFFGLSAVAILVGYAKACHWAISGWLTRYLFKGLGT